MKIKKYKTHFIIQFGGVGGQNFMFQIQFYKKPTKDCPHIRITICFNTDKLIKLFGFNQKEFSF